MLNNANAVADVHLPCRIKRWAEGSMDIENLPALQEGIRVPIADVADAI